jgi:hypothetical protein
MTVTATSLKTLYPEWDNATLTDAIINQMIDQAEREIDTELVSDTDTFDDLVMLKASDLLARSPQARSMRLVNDDYTTNYGIEFDRRASMFGSSWRTVWTLQVST